MSLRRYFRGVRVRLECGHETVIATSFYRLSESRVSAVVRSAIRTGIWCLQCEHGGQCQVVEYLGTCRLEDT